MGRKRRRFREYDEFLEEYSISERKNDLPEARKVKNQETLQASVKGENDRTGAVGREIKNRGFVVYGADGKAQVNAAAVQSAAAQLKQETLPARFYPKSYLEQQNQEISQELNVKRDWPSHKKVPAWRSLWNNPA